MGARARRRCGCGHCAAVVTNNYARVVLLACASISFGGGFFPGFRHAFALLFTTRYEFVPYRTHAPSTRRSCLADSRTWTRTFDTDSDLFVCLTCHVHYH